MTSGKDEELARLADNVSWELDTGLPVPATEEYALMMLIDGDERSLPDLMAALPEMRRLAECLARSGEDGAAWNLYNAFHGL